MIDNLNDIIKRFHNHLWFWRKVDMRGYDECWPWLAGCVRGGHGNVRVPRKLYYFKNPQIASRVAYYISYFKDPFPRMEADREGLGEPWDVHHECDNPPCCNPFHLLLITHSENVSLGWAKSPNRIKRGRSYRNFILTYSHHLPKAVEEHEISSDEHWDWRNNI